MKIDFNTWGPLTVVAVIVTVLIVAGGLVVVITGNMTYEQFLRQLVEFGKWVVGAVALARGVQLAKGRAPRPPQ